MKRSPLHESHVEAGAKLVGFAGWEMPVQYGGGVIAEHRVVRDGCGVFDISHMGEFVVSGAGAAAWLERWLTNRVAKLGVGEGQYTLLCGESGGVIDDLILYRRGEATFLLVVNAAKRDEDLVWLQERLVEGVELEDCSDRLAAVAVQGPDAAAVWARASGGAFGELPARNGIVDFGGGAVTVCRTGYTGEDGFEFFCAAGEGNGWWKRFVEAGAVPCGLGARDSLRLEMGYPLNGADLRPERTPIEAGLGYFVDLEKAFCGVEVMRRQKAEGVAERLAAFRMDGKGPPPRPHYPVLADGEVAGEVTSGGLSPSLGVGIGMAYLPVEVAAVGRVVEIDVRGRRFPGRVVKKPIYRKG